MDLEKKSLEELLNLKKQIETLITKKSKEKKSELIKKFRELAKSEGLSIEDILGSESNKPKTKTEPKYKNEQGETWTGKGRKPTWVNEALKSGKTLEEHLV